MWWGFSEALDLSNELYSNKNVPEEVSNKNARNVLLIGQYDGRHVLRTIAQKYRHSEIDSLNFYVYEPLLENIARQLLFITLALEPSENLGLAEKTLFFLELFGNTLIRPATKKYLIKVSKRLLNIVTNYSYADKILPSVNLDNLKYKERDQLEVIFKYWATCSDTFDVVTAWNERIRKELGIRYDSRYGVYDWDYHMRYHCFGADALKIQEYKRFRERGISFYFEDTDPCVPNATLASAIFPSGSKILSYGYLGDITTGPYATYGFKCEDKDMFKKVNGQMPKTATDITERNIMRILYEIQNGCPFIPMKNDVEQCLPVILKDTSSSLKIMTNSFSNSVSNQITIKDSSQVYKSLDTNNCKIIFLPVSALMDYPQKSEYSNLFDLIFISQTMVLKYLKQEMLEMFKPNSIIIVDTPKFLLNYSKDNLQEFKKNLESLMEGFQCNLIGSYDSDKDEFARFKVIK